MPRWSLLSVPFLCACLLLSQATHASSAAHADASRVERSEILGTWEGYIGTRARNATLLRFRLTLQTGLEHADQPEPIADPIDEEAQAALAEARARANAIRAGRDPESAVPTSKADHASARQQAQAVEDARLRRERRRADRVEGILEFGPLYGDGTIRIGLGGVPSLRDATGSCAVVGYLNPHSGALTITLTRLVDRPKTDLLQTSELQLVIDPSEPVLFGEAIVPLASNSAFKPVIAWREGQVPELESTRLEAVVYPNHYGGDRISRIRRELSGYTRELAALERERPIDTVDADHAHRYAQAEERLESTLTSNQSTFEKSSATYDAQEKELDEQEAAGDLSDSQIRRIASKRESIAKRRVKLAEQLEGRNAKARERYERSVADVDERVATVRAEFEAELAEYHAKRAELEASRTDVQRTIEVDNDVVAAWIERIAAEYPEIRSGDALSFSAPGARHAMQNALRDDLFADVFGAAYDELTDFDMLLLTAYFDMRNEQYDDDGEIDRRNRGRTAPQHRRGRAQNPPSPDQRDQPGPDLEARRAQQDEQRELLYGGAHSIKAPFENDYEQNLLRLYVQRRTVNWIARMRDVLQSIEPDAETFARIDAIEQALAFRSHLLRPSEQEAAMLLTIGARSEHADATAHALAARTVRESRGQAGIAALSYFWARQPALDRLVSDGTRHRINETLNEGLDLAIVEVVQALLGRIEVLDETTDPYDALALGAEIYREFLAQIGAAKRRPAAQRILGAIAARRPTDLMRVREAVSTRILAAETADEARRIAATVVTLPSDAETDAGKLMLLNVSLRTVQLESEALQALFSEREWSLLSKEHGRLIVPDDYSAPSAKEVRLATLRALAHDGGEVLDPSTCMHVVPGLGNLNIKLRMELRDVQIASVTRRDDGGYDVMYTFRRRITPEGSLTYLANDDFWQGTLLLDMLDAFGDHVVESAYETFRLGPNGWYSSTLAARLDLASAMQPLRVLTGQKRKR